MRRWNATMLSLPRALVLMISLSQFAVVVSADDNELKPGNLVSRSKWSRFDVVLGRLKLIDTRLGQNLKAKTERPDQNAVEEINYSARTPDSASLRYRYSDSHQQLVVDVERTQQITIERTGVNRVEGIIDVRFHQPRRGMLKLFVDLPDDPIEVSATSLWHLMLLEPDLCSRHLLPILSSLRKDWRLEIAKSRIEDTLLRQAQTGQMPDRQRMRDLVDQLGADQFQDRQTADQKLREMGMSVIAYFDQLETDSLDAEQRMRMKRIRRRLTHRNGDTPQRVAAWLTADPSVWLAFLRRDDLKTRQVAVERLAALRGDPVDFDVVAAPEIRQRQWNQLQREFGLDGEILITSRSSDSLR